MQSESITNTNISQNCIDSFSLRKKFSCKLANKLCLLSSLLISGEVICFVSANIETAIIQRYFIFF